MYQICQARPIGLRKYLTSMSCESNRYQLLALLDLGLTWETTNCLESTNSESTDSSDVPDSPDLQVLDQSGPIS